jgi:glycolate dehydrogenase FAD-binding subunit
MNERQGILDRAWTDLEAIVGREYVWPASASDAIDGLQPARIVAPRTAQEIAQVLQYCSSNGLGVIPRGGGTKMGFGNRPQKADLILSTERLDRIIEHAWGDMTVIVEAGCTIENVQRAVGEHGQRLAADPLWPEKSTVGGLIATGESGTLRIRYGAVRDLVLGVEVALPDGNLIKAGGKVVKNVAGYDLTKLMIGSLGTLGVITRAVFRLHPLPVATASYSASLSSADEAAKLMLAILDSHLVYTGLQVRADRPDRISLDVRAEGIPESLQDQYAKLSSIAAGYTFAESVGDPWKARQELFADAGALANRISMRGRISTREGGTGRGHTRRPGNRSSGSTPWFSPASVISRSTQKSPRGSGPPRWDPGCATVPSPHQGRTGRVGRRNRCSSLDGANQR